MHPLKPDMGTKLYVALESHCAEFQNPTIFRFLYILLKWVREDTIIRMRFPSQKTLLNSTETSDRSTLLTRDQGHCGWKLLCREGQSCGVVSPQCSLTCKTDLGDLQECVEWGRKTLQELKFLSVQGVLTARETWMLMLCSHLAYPGKAIAISGTLKVGRGSWGIF